MSSALERVHLPTRERLRAWLEEHHLTSPGIWLVLNKKASGGPVLAYGDLVEELLCFGWVDSKVNKLDAHQSLLLCTPRRPKSAWSKPNKERVERLLAAGLMRARGLELVELAKATGLWEKLDAVEALEIPPDLKAAFRRHAGSAKNFEAFPRSAKRAILEWIVQAKKPETRASRVDETARLAAENVRANQWRQPAGAKKG